MAVVGSLADKGSGQGWVAGPRPGNFIACSTTRAVSFTVQASVDGNEIGERV